MPKSERLRKLQDKSKQEVVLNALRLGCSLNAAAKLAGCSPTTIGREAQLDPEFEEQYKKIRGESEQKYLRLLSDAAEQPQYWRAAAWALERRFPKYYAARSPDVITLSQITILIAKIAQILEEEIPAPTLRKKVLKRLDSITADLRKEHASTQLETFHQKQPQQDTAHQPAPPNANPDS